MSAEVVFLEKKEALADQVAAVLLRGRENFPIDLGDTQVWVPTAGAARRIRAALAQRAAVLAPEFVQPMQALLPAEPALPLASRAEREAAWAQVLQAMPEEEMEALIPQPAALAGAAAWLGVGGQLCDLCDLLAEGGYDPAAPKVAAACLEDGERWAELAAAYGKYLALLQSVGRLDPNAARLQMLADPVPGKNLRCIVVACIPDLSTVATRWLAAMASMLNKGLRVVVLIWKPGLLAAGWDEWGRPLRKEWAEAKIPLLPRQITLARETPDEAIFALDYLAAAEKAGDFALALADETLAAEFAAEIVQRGGVPFLPGGKKLLASQAATVAAEWEKFRSAGDLRILRTLLQKPRFVRWLGQMTQKTPSQLLAACDFLICEPLAETLEQAADFLASPELPKPRALANPARAVAETMLPALEKVRDLPFSEVIRQAWANVREPSEREEAQQVLSLHDELAASPLFANWAEAVEPALTRSLRSALTFETAPAGSVELLGWLETPWMQARRLAICGCAEGSLPGSVTEHAFLPDSKRSALGLLDNAGRFARDAYILHCLILRHGAENLQLSFSKFGADGSPALPSRLLLRCEDEALPERVLQIFSEGKSGRKQPPRKNAWRWSLPVDPRPITKISPTDFKEYLTCPFRYYGKRVLGLDAYDPDPREMDARTFGLLVHSTLEAFGKTAPDEENAPQIEAFVLEQFEKEASRLFGATRAPAVRVQLEAVRVRLKAFSRVQAVERAAGWKILEVEKKFSADADALLKIGNLPISAQIDRIERHPEHGLRIMDYKTFSSFKGPEKTHFGPADANHFLAEAQVTRLGKEKSWVDLQLPLYRFIAAHAYPDAQIQIAYFVLPADPDQTAVAPLELDEEEYRSALRCATAVTDCVERGVFWPPQPISSHWSDPFAALFLNGAPEDCLDPATIAFLKGRP